VPQELYKSKINRKAPPPLHRQFNGRKVAEAEVDEVLQLVLAHLLVDRLQEALSGRDEQRATNLVRDELSALVGDQPVFREDVLERSQHWKPKPGTEVGRRSSPSSTLLPICSKTLAASEPPTRASGTLALRRLRKSRKTGWIFW